MADASDSTRRRCSCLGGLLVWLLRDGGSERETRESSSGLLRALPIVENRGVGKTRPDSSGPLDTRRVSRRLLFHQQGAAVLMSELGSYVAVYLATSRGSSWLLLEADSGSMTYTVSRRVLPSLAFSICALAKIAYDS